MLDHLIKGLLHIDFLYSKNLLQERLDIPLAWFLNAPNLEYEFKGRIKENVVNDVTKFVNQLFYPLFEYQFAPCSTFTFVYV